MGSLYCSFWQYKLRYSSTCQQRVCAWSACHFGTRSTAAAVLTGRRKCTFYYCVNAGNDRCRARCKHAWPFSNSFKLSIEAAVIYCKILSFRLFLWFFKPRRRLLFFYYTRRNEQANFSIIFSLIWKKVTFFKKKDKCLYTYKDLDVIKFICISEIHFDFANLPLNFRQRRKVQVCVMLHLSARLCLSESESTMLHISCIFHQVFMQYRHANDTKRTKELGVPAISLYVAGRKKRLLVDGLTIYRVIYSNSFCLMSRARVFYLYIPEYSSLSLSFSLPLSSRVCV